MKIEQAPKFIIRGHKGRNSAGNLMSWLFVLWKNALESQYRGLIVSVSRCRSFLRSLQSFTWVSWGYFLSTDISCRPHFRRFLPSFLCCYLFSKCNIHFFILVFSDPTLFSLSSPVLYFPCFLISIFLICLSLHILYFFFLSFLSVFYFLSCCLLSFSSNFLCLLSNFSFCFYLIFCLLLSFFAFFYFHSSLLFYCIPLTLLFILLRICVCVLLLLLLLLLL